MSPTRCYSRFRCDYDALGRLTNRTDNVGSTLYSLDANGNVTNVVENNQTNTWTYDAYNRVSAYTGVSGNLIQYHFDASGNLTNLIYPGNRMVTYAFDSQNHLTNVTDWSGDVKPASAITSPVTSQASCARTEVCGPWGTIPPGK